MDYIGNSHQQNREMLTQMGLSDVMELFQAIPKELLCPQPKDVGLAEMEGIRLMESLAEQNDRYDAYLGGGAYDHYIPALTRAIIAKSGFLTSYTPYQAEVSQGVLQAIYEFQSAICALTGMDVANASVYDGANACAEAVLMALRVHPHRKKVILSPHLHPHYRAVIEQYLTPYECEFTDHFSEDVAACLIQSPNYLGVIEDIASYSDQIHAVGGVMIQCGNPLSYALFPSPAEQEVDIVVGDCQPLGLSLSFGGPYLGYIACKQKWIRQLPGRLVGRATDRKGKEGFVLTLQAREQHIRREKATSNICTNQALAATACLVTLLWYGSEGLSELALTNYQRAQYVKEALPFVPVISGETFNEFTLTFKTPLNHVLEHFRQHQIDPGIPLYEHNALLVAITEKKSLEQLDRYIALAKELT